MTASSATRRAPNLTWAVGWTVVIFVVAAGAWAWRFYSAAASLAPPVAPSAVAPSPAPPTLSPIELAALRRRAWDKIAPRLDEADRASEAAVAEKLNDLDGFFRARRAGVPAFAADVLSLSGKWRYVKSKMPTADDDAHLKYLNERFEQYVFPTAELRQSLESVVGGYLSRLAGLESQLLVDVRADLSDSAFAVPGAPQLVPSEAAWRADFARMIDSVAADVARDVGVGASLTTASLVGGEVAAQIAVRVATAVATRLGVSAGVLSAGAASSWATFGIGLVAAVVVDYALEKAVKAAGYDPVERIAARVNAILDQVQSMLVNGDPDAVATYAKLSTLARDDPDATVRDECRRAAAAIEQGGGLGLRRELLDLHRLRAAVRREALRRLILEGEA